jgi:RNA polymerase sigma-70 factor (ECF subfamily)
METMQDIWSELAGRLRAFVARRVNDAHAADDITQDVLLKVQTQLHTLPPEDKLPAWVFAIARNAVVDYYRSRAVRSHANVEDVDAVAEPDEGDDAGPQQQLARCLARMVDQLPEPYREAMRLVDVEGLTQQEVAARVGVSLSGAKSRVQRARQQLREMILECCNVERDGRGGVVDMEPTERSARYCGGDGGSRCGE